MLKINPGLFAYQVQLGHVLKENGDSAGARAAYQKAYELSPDDSDLLRWYGNLDLREGRFQDAAEKLARSVKVNANPDATRDLAEAQSYIASMGTPTTSLEATTVQAPLPFAAVRVEVVKPFSVELCREIALFVTHSQSGALKPHVPAHLRALAAEGIATLLIMVADRPAHIQPSVLELVSGAIIRENRGYDFACWAHALRLYRTIYGASIVYLVNDSVFGPASRRSFAMMLDRVRQSPADVVGLTESYQHNWHVQSYFLALKANVLSSRELQAFFGEMRVLASKDAVIRQYECKLVPMLERAGNGVEILFPSHAVRDPTVFGWRELLDIGFPYVKVLLLRGSVADADIAGWRQAVASRGFDMSLIEATLAAVEERWDLEEDFSLLARAPSQRSIPAQPLKVAFFGPWNYDNGLGMASRGLIAAMRRSGVQLNLHPVKMPFHIHKVLSPSVDVTDFVGPADVAVIHLNPDTWPLLTEDQLGVIAAARKRVGHWVWEMSHIPSAWRLNFSAVDRIWAPSGYCASLFASEGEAPVDVIPYTVPIPELQLSPAARHDLLVRLGLPPGNRVILYAFDGSSYLIRKNPAALVRAFQESGLAKRGWTLLLKTKHLFDRLSEGRALEALAQGNDSTFLLNLSTSSGEMAELAALCDIYASPHCSEGFGLTIAEAMAAGKPVVVTDFGGSTEFVDATCGYPVAAHPWRLEEDFGHYTKGGEWARVDGPALASALRTAAAAVERGDRAIPNAARRRIVEKLSYDSVGKLIKASLNATMRDTTPVSRPSHPIVSTLSRGIRVTEAEFGAEMILIPTQADLGLSRPTAAMPPPDTRSHWIVFAPEDAYVPVDFSEIVTGHIRARPDVGIFYADDVALGEERLGEQIRLKPSFDAALLIATDYIGVPLIVRRSDLDQLGGLDYAATTAILSDLVFRAHALGVSIARIPTPLLAWKGRRPQVPLEARRRAIARLPAFASHYAIVDGLLPDTLQLRRHFDDAPDVTIIVPTCRSVPPDGGTAYVAQLLEALARTNWPMSRLHVLIGDDVVGQPEWEGAPWPFALSRVETPRGAGEPFNYAAKMNRLWRLAKTEHVVLMNDDVMPLGSKWLEALLTFSANESVGGVGSRLLYDDRRLQHAGIAPLFGTVAHAWLGLRTAGSRMYQNWPLVHREWSMVTGAVFATRRSILEQVNGFDERLTLEFNDVDLCLRLRALGYRILYTPHAEFQHTEKASRGEKRPPAEDSALFHDRWRDWLAEDPSYHPQLRRDRFDIEPIVEPEAWFT